MTETLEPNDDALAALSGLARGFFDLAAMARGACVLAPESLPESARRLLVHHDHMTVTLESAAGCPMELFVLREHQEGDDYARLILLKPRGLDHVVEFGILRLDLRAASPEVRRDVLAKTAPLGNILIRHNVLRKVEPRGYFRFDATSPVTGSFSDSTLAETFGRIATISYEGRRAIRLLEVVRGT
jgi:hypothetical protein